MIVSFLEQFGSYVFPDKVVVMSDLMSWLSNRDEGELQQFKNDRVHSKHLIFSSTVSPELVDFHVKLLRKLKRSVNPEKWERAIIKFCYSYGGVNDAFEVERYGQLSFLVFSISCLSLADDLIVVTSRLTFISTNLPPLGYLYSSASIKLRIIKNLLESQFDVNVKFKTTINQKASTNLRLEPFGRDKDGNVYYCQMDEKANIKIYQENLDEETWSVVASNRDELVKLIEELRGNRPIRPFPKDLIDEDSSSNSRPSEREEVKLEEPPQQTQSDVQPAPPQQQEDEVEPQKKTETPEKVSPAQKKRRRK